MNTNAGANIERKSIDQLSAQERQDLEEKEPTFRIDDSGKSKVMRITVPVEAISLSTTGVNEAIVLMYTLSQQIIGFIIRLQAKRASTGLIKPGQKPLHLM